MRLMLKSALRRSWRGRECVQFGVDPERAVVLEPVDGPSAGFLSLLDGTRGPDALTREAAALGLGPDRVRRMLGALAEGGVLDDACALAELSGALRHRTDALDRLRPDLAALSVVHPDPGAAAGRIRHRRVSRVRVLGAGRVGAAVASVLSAAGVGAVDVVDAGRVEPWDVAPAGIPAGHLGERRDAAGRGVVRRAAPGPRGPGRADTGPPVGDGPAGPGSGGTECGGAGPADGGSVTVVAPRDGLSAYAPDLTQSRRLIASGVPHLYTGVLEGTGLVGPLVLPGRTGCGECLALALADRDPAWPLMLAQLRSGRPPGVPACDVALATAVAGLAAAHVLAFLDGRTPPSAGGRVELSLARLSTRVRAVPPHPDCGCGAAGRPEDGTGEATAGRAGGGPRMGRAGGGTAAGGAPVGVAETRGGGADTAAGGGFDHGARAEPRWQGGGCGRTVGGRRPPDTRAAGLPRSAAEGGTMAM